jgi:hypothetical protein
LVETPESDEALGRPMLRCENNIKMALKEILYGGVE